jgi:hypothetical protein
LPNFLYQKIEGKKNMCKILSSRKEENKEASDLFVVQFQAMATQLENYNG